MIKKKLNKQLMFSKKVVKELRSVSPYKEKYSFVSKS